MSDRMSIERSSLIDALEKMYTLRELGINVDNIIDQLEYELRIYIERDEGQKKYDRSVERWD